MSRKKSPNTATADPATALELSDIEPPLELLAEIEEEKELNLEEEAPEELDLEIEQAPDHLVYSDEFHNATQLYLMEIGFLSLLTLEEEQKFSRLAIKGDLVAHKRMVEGNLRLVVKITKHYLNRGMAFLDLIEEGNLGLMHAVDKFNPELGFRFSTYATWWIRQAIERALMNQKRMIRLPIHKAKSLNAYLRAARQLAQTLDHEPTCEEMAAKLDKPLEAILDMMELSKDVTSLDTPVAKDNARLLVDTIPDDANNDPEMLIETADMQLHVDSWFSQLKPREQEILARRFGLYGHEKMGLEEVGKEVGLTRERVRQIQIEAIKKLQGIMKRAQK